MKKDITAIELAKKIYEKRKVFFDEAEKHLKTVAERAKELLPDAKVYLFGSYYRGDHHPALSDIDVAVVSPLVPENATERARLKLKIIEGYEFSPLEVHLLNLQSGISTETSQETSSGSSKQL